MYLCDFINIDGQRHFISADIRTGQLKFERVTNVAFEQFIRNILSIGEDGALPNGRLPKASEVSV
ncbi:hypothetical protein GOC53_28020 [Sinorhizobium medicae]|uniref:hypothetical protein n=1 Tax=Rhizobium meliloti TaxID=382 RepID=UPI000B4A50E1|nr:hypothetical protein [Sinorhizobium meliloti]ASP98431.1 hypothetical protein CDO24_13910 [Sinorhizobium meliloti]MDX0494071.1 hypothetical protein [Sinorhizobium medicae]MQV66176.1 hypothetical protein [Sinorhizobium meliloti]RVQ39334.1 hypothetical protein CN065_14150 [Sinorhizobium meliloti]